MTRITLTAALLAALPAHAITYLGNPSLTLDVQTSTDELTSGDVLLETIELHPCQSASITTVTVDEVIDPVVGWTSDPLPNGDYCSVVLVWGDDMTLKGDNASGDLAFSSTAASTTVTLADPIADTDLLPYTVDDGTPNDGGPILAMTIE